MSNPVLTNENPGIDRAGRRGTVYLVGAGPGAADLITVRGYRMLQTAGAVVHDDLVDPALYEGLGAVKVDVGKRSGNHKVPQPEINDLLVELASQHEVVVRLKGGDPFVFGRGREEAMHLAANGVSHAVVPGVTSALAAPSLAGIPLTHRGIAESFCVFSGHPRSEGMPFAPPPFIAERTVVVMMGVRTMPQWTAELLRIGYPAATKVAFITWAAWPEMTVLTTILGECHALADNLKAPTVAVVGEVVSLVNTAD